MDTFYAQGELEPDSGLLVQAAGLVVVKSEAGHSLEHSIGVSLISPNGHAEAKGPYSMKPGSKFGLDGIGGITIYIKIEMTATDLGTYYLDVSIDGMHAAKAPITVMLRPKAAAETE